MASTITSSVTNINYLDNIGIQLNNSGSPSGAFAVQISADYAQDEFGNVQNAGNWTALTLSPAPTVSAGSPSTIYIDMNQLSAPWIRVVYTPSGGSGTLNAFITAKAIS